MSTVEGTLGAECDKDWRWMRWRRVASIWLKWQLTAAERGTLLSTDSKEMIGSQRSWQKIIGLTERVRCPRSVERSDEREINNDRAWKCQSSLLNLHEMKRKLISCKCKSIACGFDATCYVMLYFKIYTQKIYQATQYLCCIMRVGEVKNDLQKIKILKSGIAYIQAIKHWLYWLTLIHEQEEAMWKCYFTFKSNPWSKNIFFLDAWIVVVQVWKISQIGRINMCFPTSISWHACVTSPQLKV